MGNAENIVEYSRKFVGIIVQYVDKLPRNKKFSIGSRIVDRSINILELTSEAYYSNKTIKKEKLKEINLNLEVLRQLLRCMLEIGCHNLKKHEHFIREIDNIGRMAGSWLKSLG